MSAPDRRERLAWAYLAAVAEPPCPPLISLVGRYGAVETARMIRTRTLPAGNAAAVTATQARYETDSAATDLETAHRRGARLVTPDDEEWPGWALLGLDQASTSVRGGAPLALWVRGPGSLAEAASSAVGLVGSRAATAYGEHVSTRMASDLADRGVTVVSGGAFGIDGAAHRGALAAGGLTVAILACGIDRDYPSGHARLLREIGEAGLVVSEYPPGTTAAKHRFLTRNRLVAALSAAVVVVEAGRRSGATNTAAWARKLGRPLGAVPGPITSAMSVGCHQMIADGQATLVMDADSILALIRATGHDNFVRSAPSATDDLPTDEFEVIEALPASGGLTVDEIAFSAGRPVTVVLAALARLELKGLVDSDSGLWRLAGER